MGDTSAAGPSHAAQDGNEAVPTLVLVNKGGTKVAKKNEDYYRREVCSSFILV